MKQSLLPLSVCTNSNPSETRRLRVDGDTGVLFEVDLTALSGTSPALSVLVQTSLDGLSWIDSEGVISLSAAGRVVIQRFGLGPFVRVAYWVSGTTPTATFSVQYSWISEGDYAATAQVTFESTPTADQPLTFTVSTGVAGALVSWTSTFDPSGGEAGSGTANSEGNFTTTTEVPSDAIEATVAAVTLGQTPDNTESVIPPPP